MAVDVRREALQATPSPAAHDIQTVKHTTCCIVGAGPAGAMLALLLARQAIPVLLLEAHADFEREFRGDTVHPSTMQLLDELGLADRLLELPHTKIRQAALPTEPPVTVDFGFLPTRFPYITMMPQAQFLEFLTAEAARLPSFELLMGASVRELVEQDDIVRGVRCQTAKGWIEVRALLTVGADGRFSRLRHLSRLRAIKSSPAIDVLWFRLPRRPSDPSGAAFRFRRGHAVVLLDRGEMWQMAYLLPKGGYQQLHADGLPGLRQTLVELVPWLEDRVDYLTDWKQAFLLSVESDRLERWYRPGLLLIGDAAHTMSPVGGVGINYAIQDAVATANLLPDRLRAGRLSLADLARVQRRREPPIRVIQVIQAQIQNRLLAPALSGAPRTPELLRWLSAVPALRRLPPYLLTFGIRPEHVRAGRVV